jgi:hypothetical protein
MAGYLTPLAFRAAADPAQFPEQIAEGLRPWQAKKLYRGAPFRVDPENPADRQRADRHRGRGAGPHLCRDRGRGSQPAQVAGDGQHRTDGAGGIGSHPPLSPPVGGRDARARALGFDGIDVSLAARALSRLPAGSLRAELAPSNGAREALATYHRSIRRASCRCWPRAAATRAAQAGAAGARRGRGKADRDFLLSAKERDFTDAVVRAAVSWSIPLSDAETVTPGGVVTVSARTFLPYPGIVTITNNHAPCPRGLASRAGAAAAQPPTIRAARRGAASSPTAETRYAVTVPAAAAMTQPYFLREPRRGDMYQWPAGLRADDAVRRADPLRRGVRRDRRRHRRDRAAGAVPDGRPRARRAAPRHQRGTRGDRGRGFAPAHRADRRGAQHAAPRRPGTNLTTRP